MGISFQEKRNNFIKYLKDNIFLLDNSNEDILKKFRVAYSCTEKEEAIALIESNTAEEAFNLLNKTPPKRIDIKKPPVPEEENETIEESVESEDSDTDLIIFDDSPFITYEEFCKNMKGIFGNLWKKEVSDLVYKYKISDEFNYGFFKVKSKNEFDEWLDSAKSISINEFNTFSGKKIKAMLSNQSFVNIGSSMRLDYLRLGGYTPYNKYSFTLEEDYSKEYLNKFSLSKESINEIDNYITILKYTSYETEDGYLAVDHYDRYMVFVNVYDTADNFKQIGLRKIEYKKDLVSLDELNKLLKDNNFKACIYRDEDVFYIYFSLKNYLENFQKEDYFNDDISYVSNVKK